MNGAKVASERRNARFFPTAISQEQRDQDTKIEDFCENLIVSTFLSKSLPAGVQEKRKVFGGSSAPPGLKRVLLG